MKTDWRVELPLLLLLAGMFVLAFATWPTAPERIPVHWGMTGEVDRYGGRLEGLFALPGLAVVVYLLMLFLPRIDPGRANYARFGGAYAAIRAAVLLIFAVLYGVTHLIIRGAQIDMPRVVGLMVGAMFFLFGNLLGKIRPNWFVGVRTPWTLSSKRAWTKTHRLAGWVFILGGFAIMAAGILKNAVAVWAAGVVLLGGTALAAVYSYLVWRTDPDRVPPAGTQPPDGEA
jgi:uncharacterized membrane protein